MCEGRANGLQASGTREAGVLPARIAAWQVRIQSMLRSRRQVSHNAHLVPRPTSRRAASMVAMAKRASVQSLFAAGSISRSLCLSSMFTIHQARHNLAHGPAMSNCHAHAISTAAANSPGVVTYPPGCSYLGPASSARGKSLGASSPRPRMRNRPRPASPDRRIPTACVVSTRPFGGIWTPHRAPRR